MFYDVYIELCKKIGKKPSVVASELGINKSNVSNWKNNGYTPRGEALQRIADYFDTTVDYLMGRTNDPENSDRFGLEDPADRSLDIFRDIQKAPTLVSESGQPVNVVKIAGRDGSFMEKRLNDKDLKLLMSYVELLPDADDL